MASRLESFKIWWHAPIRRRDRVLGALVGGFGCFWLGVLAFVVYGSALGSNASVAAFVAASAVLGVMLGIVFQKAVTVVCFPFATFGGSS